MTTVRTTTELLAPAGDWTALRAAVANGADAVYFGLSDFNARHRATNFTLDELPEVIAYLHRHNVRGYVTCNTLIFSDELPEIARFVAAIAEAGADAVIVQDLGLARLIGRLAPELPVHGSTQMTLTEPRGIEFVRRLGVERVILARELSLSDIERVRAATDLPVEVFVHGALCVAYSGQCLTSEALGGRSANRGQCAQACRLPYDLIVDGEHRELGDHAYLLSPQDLAGHDHVDELVRLGVASLKIEGRLKSAHYVAATTRTYRRALDAAERGERFSLDRQERLDLTQSFSRGFTPGFLEGADHQRLVHGRFPKSRGVYIGTVVEARRGRLIVELASEHEPPAQAGGTDYDAQAGRLRFEAIKPGDGVVFDEGHPEQDEQGGRVWQVRPVPGAGHRVELLFREGAVNVAAVATGSLVWKTDDPAFRRRIEQTFARDATPRRVRVTAHVAGRIGGPLLVRLSDGEHAVRVEWPGPLEAARKHALDERLVREQFGRLGDTPFELGEVELDIAAPVMAPKSVLNDLRRRAVAELLDLRNRPVKSRAIYTEALPELRREIMPASPRSASSPAMYVLVRTREQLDAVCAWSRDNRPSQPAMIYCDFEDVRRYRDAVAVGRSAGLQIGLATLRIIKPGEEGLLAKIAAAEADAVLVRNLAALEWFREHAPRTPLVGDFSLNVANELTADLFFGAGLTRLVPSYDLSWEQLVAMLPRTAADRLEVVVHQHIPMFHNEHCVFAAALSEGKDWRDCGRPCDRHRVELRDRVGAEFPLLADTGCRNTVFNSVAQSAAEYVPRMLKLGLQHFRIELLREDAAAGTALLTRYRRVLDGLDNGKTAWRGLQVLNQLGVTRGTLG
ncbi:MAG TPA: U32 family peptidase [Pirellulales bacterium]|nr:U32 family peptidase [Pirellulales bacterium]